MSDYKTTSQEVFQTAFSAARAARAKVAEACSPADTATAGEFHLSEDNLSGFRVKDGELTHVFSTVSGRGSSIINAAIVAGATYLDCFDGYLPTLYSRHGFKEVKREKNWTEGEPDVVFMKR